MSVASTTALRTYVSIRLPNSICSWMPVAPVGTNEFFSHRGQVGHPSPDPVSRTAPPVTTIPMFATIDARASRRRPTGRKRGEAFAAPIGFTASS